MWVWVWAWGVRGVGCSAHLPVIRGRRLVVERTLLFRTLLVRGSCSLIRRTLRSLLLHLVGTRQVVRNLQGVAGTERWRRGM